jgi:hypothetical protein
VVRSDAEAVFDQRLQNALEDLPVGKVDDPPVGQPEPAPARVDPQGVRMNLGSYHASLTSWSIWVATLHAAGQRIRLH